MKNFLRKFVLGWIINAFAIYLASYYLVDFNYDSWVILAVVSLAFGIVAWLISPVLKILSLPLFFLGPFIYFLADGALLWAIGYFVDGFATGDIITTVVAGVMIGIINFVAHMIV